MIRRLSVIVLKGAVFSRFFGVETATLVVFTPMHQHLEEGHGEETRRDCQRIVDNQLRKFNLASGPLPLGELGIRKKWQQRTGP
jgi:hypothetical protein